MRITAVRVETLQLEMEEPLVIASSALAASPCDGVSTVLVPQAPGLGTTPREDAVAAQRVARLW